MTRVAAVVVHWGSVEETLGCVAALRGTPDLDVIVVDNGSPHPVAAALARMAPEARCLRSERNLGYAGGGNLGLREALGRGAGVVLLLNDDARVAPPAMAAALGALAADPRIAVVGGKVLTREDPGRLWLAWGRVTFGPDLVALCGADAADGPAWSAQRDVDWVAGCALWLRREALAALGLLDEAFFAYHEEVEWCARARRAGWRVVYAPQAVVEHTGRGSGGSPAAVRARKYLTARNSVLFVGRHATRAQRWRFALSLAATLPAQLLWHLPRGTAGDVLAKLRGVRDGLLRRPPPLARLGLD